MSRTKMTLEEVEQEITRLKQSPHVKLAQKEQQIKQDRRRKRLSCLRWYERRGEELAAAGATMENIRAFVEAEESQTN